MSPTEAKKLDEVLGAQGTVFAAYVTCSQYVDGDKQLPAMDQVLGLNAFSTRLARYRKQYGFTLSSLAITINEILATNVTEDQLSTWELGRGIPRKHLWYVVSILDQIYSAEGSLIESWTAENPRPEFSAYARRFVDWNKITQGQFNDLILYKESNPNEWPEQEDSRWTSPASRERAKETLERFFGFLVREKGFTSESLSLTLVADWDLVIAFFEYVRTRVGRDDYSCDVVAITSVFINWYDFYLVHLHQEATELAYWSTHLPSEATLRKEEVPGVMLESRVPLTSARTRWKYQLLMASEKAKQFRAESVFGRTSFGASAAPLLGTQNSLSKVASVIASMIRMLPLRIDSIDVAILCRRLAAAVLLLSRCFRPETLRSLRMDQVIIKKDLRIWLDIPEDQFKTKGKGGSYLGFHGYLPEYDYMHAVIRRYINEARPFLLGESSRRSSQDDGYFLTPECLILRAAGDRGLVPGGPLDQELLRRDAIAVLGFAPYSLRILFGTEALAKSIDAPETARVLMNSGPMVVIHYRHQTAALRGQIANEVMDCLLPP